VSDQKLTSNFFIFALSISRVSTSVTLRFGCCLLFNWPRVLFIGTKRDVVVNLFNLFTNNTGLVMNLRCMQIDFCPLLLFLSPLLSFLTIFCCLLKREKLPVDREPVKNFISFNPLGCFPTFTGMFLTNRLLCITFG